MEYSEKIKEKAYRSYKYKRFAFIFVIGTILFGVIVGFFVGYGLKSNWMDIRLSAAIGIVLGIFVLWVVQFPKLLERTWDGVVVKKRAYASVSGNEYAAQSDEDMRCVFYVKKDHSRRVYKHVSNLEKGLYEYYNIGDSVRHHRGFDLYEKLDKSNDSMVLCQGCGQLIGKTNDTCRRCHLPLLK